MIKLGEYNATTLASETSLNNMLMEYNNMSTQKLSKNAHKTFKKLVKNVDISTVDSFYGHFFIKDY